MGIGGMSDGAAACPTMIAQIPKTARLTNTDFPFPTAAIGPHPNTHSAQPGFLPPIHPLLSP